MSEWYQIQMLRNEEWCNIGDIISDLYNAVSSYHEINNAHKDMDYRLIKVAIVRPIIDTNK